MGVEPRGAQLIPPAYNHGSVGVAVVGLIRVVDGRDGSTPEDAHGFKPPQGFIVRLRKHPAGFPGLEQLNAVEEGIG